MQVALIGSAPASVRLAPYNNPEWTIWGCSPGVYGVAPRTDVWLELHRYEPGQPWFSPEYCQFLARYPGPVYMAEKRPEIPNSVVLPVADLVAKYGPYFFSSSIAWMMAMAIEAGATKIGLWGVDMAATEEYGYQRAGLQYFAQLAIAKGIEVGVPPESDLFRPAPLYGVSEIEHGQIKLLARKRELQQRIAMAQAQAENSKCEVHFLQGALDNNEYMTKTWTAQDGYLSPPASTLSVDKNWRAYVGPEPIPNE